MKKYQILFEPQPRKEWRLRRFAEQYGSPSEHLIVLKNGGDRIEIYGGNTDYEEGGILEVKINGVKVFRYDTNVSDGWDDYWKKHPKKLLEYDLE